MISTLLLALALQSSFDARAREYGCNDAQTQLAMNMCAELDFERADAQLNAAGALPMSEWCDRVAHCWKFLPTTLVGWSCASCGISSPLPTS